MIRSIVIFALTASFANAESLIATRVVKPNTVISAEDIALAETPFAGALSGEDDIVGMEARITLYPGRPIMPGHVGPAAILRRNQIVTLQYNRNGLQIETEGRVLTRGAIGETVRVMNLSSRATVTGLVTPTGTVRIPVGGQTH